MGSPASHRISVPGGTQVPGESQSVFAYGTITLCGRSFQKPSTNKLVCHSHVPGPTTPPVHAQTVWAIPRSLATTSGMISFPPGTKMFQFPGFPSACLCVQHEMREVRSRGFPHSEIYGYNACTRLPEAYRSVLRPSSALDAKASTICP